MYAIYLHIFAEARLKRQLRKYWAERDAEAAAAAATAAAAAGPAASGTAPASHGVVRETDVAIELTARCGETESPGIVSSNTDGQTEVTRANASNDWFGAIAWRLNDGRTEQATDEDADTSNPYARAGTHDEVSNQSFDSGASSMLFCASYSDMVTCGGNPEQSPEPPPPNTLAANSRSDKQGEDAKEDPEGSFDM
jgi:hypothetical protein